MATVSIRIEHRLGREEARQRLVDGLAQMPQSDLAQYLTFERQTWTTEGFDFEARTMGQAFAGQILIGADHADFVIPLPWYLLPFRSQVEAQIRKYGALLFDAD